MSSYLMKYKGIYRLKTPIDSNNNDFPRNFTDGNLATEDVYIDCQSGCQITHYGHSTLVVYIPSIGKGHNIIKAMASDLTYQDKVEYSQACQIMLDSKLIWDIIESDFEVEFKFNAKNIELIAKYLKPRTSGAGISPFSTRNLPKSKYVIPNDKLEEYKRITSEIDKGNLLLISQCTSRFFSDILSKKRLYRGFNFTKDMRKKCLKGKEYIHSIGEWDNYITYLKENLINGN